MELKIGDKVRYLDAVGGGIIQSFKGKDQVIVLEEDGFETPVLKRQCVVIEEKKAQAPAETGKVPTSTTSRTATSDTGAFEHQKVVNRTPTVTSYKTPQDAAGEVLNVQLAFLPAEGHTFQETIFEAYLINESNYNLHYSYANAVGASWSIRSAGVLEANSKIFLEEFNRESIPDLERLNLQYLAYKPDRAYTFKNPGSVEIRLDTVKFYKIHCFRTNDYFDEDALVVPLVISDVPERSLMTNPEAIRQAMLEKKADKPSVSVPLTPKSNQPLEVDLHADALLDTTSGMNAAAILQHQLDVFRKTMDENTGKKGFKIVFIHGKGEGVLRSALLKELALRYKTCRYQDASFREYGFGATLVIVG